MRIDCDECVGQGTEVCRDCIVTALLERPEGAVVFDVAQERAIRSLQQVGLAPTSRFLPRTGHGEVTQVAQR